MIKKRGLKSPILNDTPYAIAMLAPNITLFFLFMLFPIIWTFVMSLTRFDIITPMRFIGFNNYINIFRDEVAMECLRNTIVFTIITVPTGMVVSLLLAVLLDTGIKHFKRIYRVAFFYPLDYFISCNRSGMAMAIQSRIRTY